MCIFGRKLSDNFPTTNFFWGGEPGAADPCPFPSATTPMETRKPVGTCRWIGCRRRRKRTSTRTRIWLAQDTWEVRPGWSPHWRCISSLSTVCQPVDRMRPGQTYRKYLWIHTHEHNICLNICLKKNRILRCPNIILRHVLSELTEFALSDCKTCHTHRTAWRHMS